MQKRGKERKKNRLEMEREKLQEVKVYKYLEYIVQRNRGQQIQMREGRRKAVIAMREV